MLEKEPNIVVTCNIISHLEGLCWQWCFKNFPMPPPISRDLPRNCKGTMECQEVLYDMQGTMSAHRSIAQELKPIS